MPAALAPAMPAALMPAAAAMPAALAMPALPILAANPSDNAINCGRVELHSGSTLFAFRASSSDRRQAIDRAALSEVALGRSCGIGRSAEQNGRARQDHRGEETDGQGHIPGVAHQGSAEYERAGEDAVERRGVRPPGPAAL